VTHPLRSDADADADNANLLGVSRGRAKRSHNRSKTTAGDATAGARGADGSPAEGRLGEGSSSCLGCLSTLLQWALPQLSVWARCGSVDRRAHVYYYYHTRDKFILFIVGAAIPVMSHRHGASLDSHNKAVHAGDGSRVRE